MGATKKIPRTEWKTYFDRFTKRHLNGKGGVHMAAVVEVLSPALGDQFEATLMPLLGMTYDPKSNAVELLLESLDHLVFLPAEIWVIEAEDGFITAIELVRGDGTKEIIHLRQSGPPALRYETLSRPER